MKLDNFHYHDRFLLFPVLQVVLSENVYAKLGGRNPES